MVTPLACTVSCKLPNIREYHNLAVISFEIMKISHQVDTCSQILNAKHLGFSRFTNDSEAVRHRY